jgi:hypothetical protein
MWDAVLRWIKRLGIGGGLVVGLVYILFCAYSLPSFTKVHVTGTEVTRKDVENQKGEKRTDDVRYVMAEALDGGPRMYRNQDTGWGWPPYLKFDEGNLAAQATNYSVDGREEVVLVKHYGFRIPMLSAFPNVISMKTVPEDYQVLPWTRIVIGVAHLILLGVVFVFFRDFREAREGKD